MSAHTGTHIEASLHFNEVGLPIDQVPPEILIGECRVIDLKDRGASILDEGWAKNLRGASRLLIRSDFSDADQVAAYPDHGPLLEPGAAEILLESGLKLLGTDRYSVDASTQPEFTLHRQLLGAGCVIVEGLLLTQISTGKYGLIVAPLPLVGAEASPARAFLRLLPHAV
jgi:arylformamidase